MTVGKLQARNDNGKMLRFASGKLMGECCCGALPEIELTGTLDFYGVECDADTETDIATVKNIGAADSVLTWGRVLDMDAGLVGFLTALPASGSLVKDASEPIDVALAKSGISAGTYTATLTVSEQLLSGVTPAELPITVQIDTYASFPLVMSNHFLIGAPVFALGGHYNQAKAQNATYCVTWAQTCGRKRTDGQWYLFAASGTVGPIEMWYNPDYGFESKYIYTNGGNAYFLCESATPPWTGSPAWPYTWTRGPEPASVAVT